jgi:VCBS repeat-containing protein
MNAPTFNLTGSAVTASVTEDADAPTITTIISRINFDDQGAGLGVPTAGEFHGLFISNVGSPIGTLTATIIDDATGGGDTTGFIEWSYSVNNAALQYLGFGETRTEEFTIEIVDSNGQSALQTVTITVTGTNDGPAFTSTVGGPIGLVEDLDPLTAIGSLTFNDVDVIDDNHTATISVIESGDTTGLLLSNPALAALLTTVVTSTAGLPNGTIDWTFAANNLDFQYLDDGEILTLTYTITLTDDFGLTDTETFVINITGSNDTATIAVANSAVTEADAATPVTIMIGDFVTITDADKSDADNPTLYVEGSGLLDTSTGPMPPMGTREDLITFDETTGEISYDRADFNWLDGDENVIYTFTFESESGNDGTEAQTFTLTINGQNDVASIVVTNPTDVSESDAAALVSFTIGGQVAITDADSQDALVPVNYVASSGMLSAMGPTPPMGTLAGLVTFNAVTGAVDYDRNAFNWLDDDESVTYTITFDAQSGDDTAQSKTLTFTISGQNDAATITVVNRVNATESDVSALVSFNISDQVTITDPDKQDADNPADYVASSGIISASGTAPAVGTLASLITFDAVTGAISYDRNAFNYLDDTQSVTYTVDFNSASGDDGNVPQSFTFTITGANDAPVVVSNTAPAAITDPAGNVTTTLSGTNVRSGTIVIDDVDDTDSIGINSVTGFLGSGGTLSASDITAIRAAATFTGTITGLAAGDITDIRNAFDVTGAAFNATTNELTINWTFDNIVAGGTAVAGLAAGAVGTVALNYLAAGESFTITFPVTITDGTTPLIVNVPITFTGTNDAPTGTQTRSVFLNEGGGDARFTALAPGGQLVDNNTNAGVDNGFAGGTHTVIVDGGTLSDNQNFRIAYSDTDRSEIVHTLAAPTVAITTNGGSAGAPDMAAALDWFAATLTQRTAGNSGQINWTLTAPDAAFNYLGAGDTLTLVYQLNVLDGANVSTTGPGRTVTVTITGTNDAFTVTAEAGDAISGGVTETNVTGLIATDTLTVTDADLTDVHTAQVHSVAVNSGADGGISNAVLKAMMGVSASDITAVATGTGQLTWTFTSSATFDYLADGETLVLDYIIRVSDDASPTPNFIDKTVTITITGSNDAPAITAIDVAGAVIEDAASPTLTDTGSISFTDLDVTDLSSVTSAVQATTTTGPAIPGALTTALAGAFALSGATGPINAGTVTWTFSLANSLAQYLNDGETVTVTYRISVTDDSAAGNATSFQDVTITITGTNDGPVALADTNGMDAVTEAGDEPLVAGDSSATGNVLDNDTDADTTATEIVVGVVAGTSMVPVAGGVGNSIQGTYGSVTLGANGVWTYTLDNALANGLAAGQSATDVFTYTMEDDNGAQSTTTLTINITGSNDAPVITAGGMDTGSVAEPAGTPGVVPTALNGSFAFTDADLNDLPGSGGMATLGATLVVTPGTLSAPQTAAAQLLLANFTTSLAMGADNNGTINWAFAPAAGSLDFLRASQTATLTFTVEIADGNGGTATRDVVITLTGTNDEVVAGGGVDVVVASVTETTDPGATPVTATGSFDYREPDLLENVVQITRQGSSTLVGAGGTVTHVLGPQSADGTRSLTWTYNNTQSQFDYLGEGETATDVFRIRVLDQGGAPFDQVITITITGDNDRPVITAVNVAGDVTEDSGLTLTDSGSLSFIDVDTLDTSDVTVSALDVATTGPTVPMGLSTALTSALTISGDILDANDGNITWNFSLLDSLVQYLNAGETVTAVYTITVTDDSGAGNADATQNVTVTITGTNDAPVITTAIGGNEGTVEEAGELDGAAVVGDAIATGTLTSSDADTTATATWTGSIAGDYGTFTITTAGVWTYTLNPMLADALDEGDIATETFTATVTDDNMATNTQLVTITITGTNDAPVITSLAAQHADTVTESGLAADDMATVPGDVTATGTLTRADPDADATATWSITNVSAYGVMAINAMTGVWTFTLNQALADELDEGHIVTETFTATVTDDMGAEATQVITVTINGTNDAPVITSLVAAHQGDVTEAGHLDNGTGVPGTPSASGTVTSSDVDDDATFSWSGGATGTYGTFAIDAMTGAWTYTLNPGMSDTLAEGETETETFMAIVTDDMGATATQTITITVHGTNDKPVVTTAVGGNEGAVIEAGDLDNGTDVPGIPSVTGTLTSADPDAMATATWTGTLAGTYGNFAISAGGVWTYTINQAFADALDEGQIETETFTATVTDVNGATATQVVTITVNGTNDAPVVTSEIGADQAENFAGFTDFDVSSNYTDADHDTASLTFAVSSTAVSGSGNVLVDDLPLAVGVITVQAGGIIRYTPGTAFDALSDGQTATVTVNYTVTDSLGAATSGTLTFTVNGADEIQMGDDNDNTLTGTSFDDQLLGLGGDDTLNGGTGNDELDGGVGDDTLNGGSNDDRLTGGQGSDNYNGGSGIDTAVLSGVWSDYSVSRNDTTGVYTFVNDTEIDTLTGIEFVLFGGGTAVAIADVLNDAPTLVSEIADKAGTEDTAVNFILPAGTFADLDTPLGDSLTYSLGSGAPGWLSIDASTGRIYGTPDSNINGTFAVTIIATDVHGITASDSFNLVIAAVNDAPVIDEVTSNLARSSNEDTVIIGTIVASDVDLDTLTYALATGGSPAHGSVTFSGGTYSYTPTGNYNGADSFTVQVSDGHGGIDTVVVNVTVGAVNDAPVIDEVTSNLAPSDNEDTVSTGAIIATDVDLDILTYALASGGSPAHGSVTFSGGTYSYTPTGNYNGTDSFTVQVSDGHGGIVTVVVNVTVGAVNDAPVVAAALVDQTGTEDTVFTFPVPAGTFTDVDNATLTLSLGEDAPSWLSINSAGVISGTPPLNFNGTVLVTVIATDASGLTATDSFDIAVGAVNDAPTGTATAELAAGTEDVDYTVSAADLLAGFSDIDDDTLSVSDLISSSGTVTDNGDGTFTISAPLNANGTVTLSYNVIDGNDGTVAATQTFTRDAVNDAPVLTVDTSGAVTEHTAVDGSGMLTDSGALSVVDVDTTDMMTISSVYNDDATWTGGSLSLAQTAALSAAFTTSGSAWNYSLANNVVDFLDPGQTITLSFDVIVTDNSGTLNETDSETVTVVISGALNPFTGTSAANTITGTAFGDRITGLAGVDNLFGGGGADIVDGGDGGDQLWGGLGADQHIGGDDAGVDYARYDDANYGNLTIRLDAPSFNVGAAAVGDTYTGIEGLVGGVGNDTVVGNASANFLFGGGGVDNIFGQAGADYLNGGAGGDQLWGGAGADIHIGGDDAGVDYARYDDANYGNLTLRLDAPLLNAGAVAVGDTYTGIEGLVGGLGNDVVVGNTSNNYLFGGGGNDYIDARAGNDYLNGGAGADRFVFATALGATNVDTIADFVHLTDDIVLAQSIFADIGATLDASEFQVGMADAATDRIIYNNVTGQLFYDSNGNVTGGMTLFATVTAGTVLDVDDFLMV